MDDIKQKGYKKEDRQKVAIPKIKIGSIGDYKPIPKVPNKCLNC